MADTEEVLFAAGMQVRREWFGPAGAEERYAQATDFNRPFEDVVTRYCFGETWTLGIAHGLARDVGIAAPLMQLVSRRFDAARDLLGYTRDHTEAIKAWDADR